MGRVLPEEKDPENYKRFSSRLCHGLSLPQSGRAGEGRPGFRVPNSLQSSPPSWSYGR